MTSSQAAPNPALANLHDIAMPEAINSLPIAVGWWVLLAIILCSLFFIIKYSLKTYQQRAEQKRWKDSLNKKISALNAISDDKAFEQSALIYIQQLVLSLSNHQDVLTGQQLKSQLELWLSSDDAEFLAIRRYQASLENIPREQYLDIIQTLSNQLEADTHARV